MRLWRPILIWAVSLAPSHGATSQSAESAGASPANPCLQCDREIRKTIESLQAWRRQHQGRYPGRIINLKDAGLLPRDGALCPDWRQERQGANASHEEASSRDERGDPPGTYEYELSDRVSRAQIEKNSLPDNTPPITRQDIKVELLRRQFYQQVPILRCSSHRSSAPPPFAGHDDVRRNGTVEGTIYWSRTYWEQLFLENVPYCARDVLVKFGLKGPPFYTERAPAIPNALDLRPWACAFGDVTWWWPSPLFSERQSTPNLKPFFNEEHGRAMQLAGDEWWLDGLVQLQGRLRPNPDVYHEPGMLAFVWQHTGLPVGKAFREASWLQGTVWTNHVGGIAGWLVWHYADSIMERVPMVYGKTTARFWADSEQLKHEQDFPEPVWSKQQTAEEVKKERVVRLYRQTWTNPRPDVPVASLDFVSNSNSPASPFLIAIDLKP